MYRVLTEKILEQYNSLITQRDKLIANVSEELQKALTELEKITLNGKLLPQKIIDQIKSELAVEYCKEYKVDELDTQISFWENFIVKEELE